MNSHDAGVVIWDDPGKEHQDCATWHESALSIDFVVSLLEKLRGHRYLQVEVLGDSHLVKVVNDHQKVDKFLHETRHLGRTIFLSQLSLCMDISILERSEMRGHELTCDRGRRPFQQNCLEFVSIACKNSSREQLTSVLGISEAVVRSATVGCQ